VSNSKKLALIAIGYVLSVAVGFVAAAVNEALMPDDVAQGSPGMVAFGDMILFIFVTGFFSLAPTWFLQKLLVATAPRTLLTAELLIAAMGPVSWLAMTIMAVTTPPGGPSLQNVPQAAAQLFGLFLAFGAIPRMVLGPVLVVIEGVTFHSVPWRRRPRAAGGGDVDGRCSYRPLRAAFCTYGPLLNVCQQSSGAV
jgi:hypothetical protein